MQISSNLSENEILEYQQKFYEYFETGYEFEDFLKEYLLRIGLDEIQVTKRSRDKGVDLIAVRKGMGDFSEIDVTNYYIQAKRNAPKNKVVAAKIRELKGTMPFGHKGIFITTSDFTADAITETMNDPSKPVIAINGRKLLMSCIDNQIGFVFKPIFSVEQMNIFMNKKSKLSVEKNKLDMKTDYIEKMITSNDIRARIVSIPSAIMKQFDDNQTSFNVVVNNEKNYKFNVNKRRNYFGSVTNFLKDYNLLTNDGLITAKQSKWYYDKDKCIVRIYIEE